jgi:hypothetical protein
MWDPKGLVQFDENLEGAPAHDQNSIQMPVYGLNLDPGDDADVSQTAHRYFHS